MIIWINGAFGAGKTQAAYELQRRLPGSFVYDPENVGFFIRRNIPPELCLDDFQEYPLWRSANREMLDYIAERYPGDIIVPMTITNKAYYDEIIGTLAKKYTVKHLILCARRETLLKRLASRFESRQSWAGRQIDRCIKAFEEDIPEYRIDTDGLCISQVVDRIAEAAGLCLLEDRRSVLRRGLDRLMTQCRHIR